MRVDIGTDEDEQMYTMVNEQLEWIEQYSHQVCGSGVEHFGFASAKEIDCGFTLILFKYMIVVLNNSH